VGEPGDACAQPGLDFGAARRSVAGAEDGPALRHEAKDPGGHAFGRKRDQGDAVAERSGALGVSRIGNAEHRLLVGALARRREVGAFQVDAEHARR